MITTGIVRGQSDGTRNHRVLVPDGTLIRAGLRYFPSRRGSRIRYGAAYLEMANFAGHPRNIGQTSHSRR